MGDLDTYQNAVVASHRDTSVSFPFMALVLVSYSDRMACDIQTWDGGTIYNVPVLTKCGINSSNQIWGELDLPQAGDYVLVFFVGPYNSQPVILGTVFPYLMNYFQSNQTPVDSSSKQFTKKILEINHENTYRRVYKSGATLEVGEDGTVTIETPSGMYFQISEANSNLVISAQSNTITLESGKVLINGNLEIDQ